MKNGKQTYITKAGWRDLPAVLRLEKACFPLDAWPIWDVVAALTFPRVVRLKVEISQKVVGFVAADVRLGQDITWIATIGVLPEFQRQGIGTALLQACEQQLPTRRIRLSVRRSNLAAIVLYQQMGYCQTDVWPRYYQGGEDGLVMEKVRQMK